MNAPRRIQHMSASAIVRVLAAIRSYFRIHGYSPSYREIGALAGVTVGRVGEYLDKLQDEGYLRHANGVARSIRIVDRMAGLSDEEVEAGCHGRNWTVIKPPEVAAFVGTAFPAEPICPLDLVGVLNKIK